MNHSDPFERDNSPSSIAMEVQDLVLSERVRGLYSKAAVAFFATAINAIIIVLVFWDIIDPVLLLSWLGTVALIIGIRLVIRAQYRSRPRDPSQSMLWARLFTAGAGLNGIIWGIAGVLFFTSADLPRQMLLIFVLGGMTAGAATSLSSYMPAFAAFTVPTLVPTIARLFVEGGSVHIAMGTMLGLYGGSIAGIARIGGQALIEAIQLRVENGELAKRLYTARERLVHSEKMEAMGRLVSGVAHEFNNVMMGIKGCSTLVSRAIGRKHPARIFVVEIDKAVDRAAGANKRTFRF